MTKGPLLKRIEQRFTGLRLKVNEMLDQQPLAAAGVCAAVGGLMGLVVGVAFG